MGNGSYGHWSMALLLGFLVSFHAPQAYAGDASLAPPPQVEVPADLDPLTAPKPAA